MSSYLITYDLNRPGQKHAKVLEKIKSYGTWAMLSESSYVIITHESPRDVYNTFEPYLDGNDKFYVIKISKPFWGQGSKELNEWLSENLD